MLKPKTSKSGGGWGKEGGGRRRTGRPGRPPRAGVAGRVGVHVPPFARAPGSKSFGILK